MFRTTLILASSIAFAASLTAQSTSTKDLYWGHNLGVDAAYLQTGMAGHVKSTQLRKSTHGHLPQRMRYSAEGRVFVKAKFLCYRKRCLEVKGNAFLTEGVGTSNSDGYTNGAHRHDFASAQLRLYIGSSQIWYDGIQVSGRLAEYGLNLTAFDARQTFYVAYIPVTLRGYVNANLGFGLSTALRTDPASSRWYSSESSIGLAGYGSGNVEATGEVMLGWSGLGAGFSATWRFLDSTLKIEAGATTSGLRGMLELRTQPLKFWLKVFAEAGVRVSRTIYSWYTDWIWTARQYFN